VFRVPSALRRGTAAVLNAIPDAVVGHAARLLPSSVRPALPADRFKKAVAVLPGDVNAFYLRMVSQCPDPSVFVRDPSEHPLPWSLAGSGALLRRMQLFDTATYLPDDILQKVDRASMAWALEVRPPMLDHRVVELALRLPRRFLVRDGRSKWLLRKVLDRYVPRDLIDRPKRGFGVPLADWLRGPLRDWCEDLLDPKRFGGGLLNVDAARSLWEGHISGRRNSHYAIWALLMFEGWRRRWGG
jgi:asparagine synthase (glutamine-hydrolysing)